MPLIYLVAGEASGDAIGAKLMRAISAQHPETRFVGIGGMQMQTNGLISLFPMQDLALMGLFEVLPQLRRLRLRLRQAVADIASQRPDVVVTIDSPGFTLRLLRAIRPLGIKRVHYVAPQAWAWREGRVKHYPGLWDQLLCLLPFEPAFFAKFGLPATFVGHPVLESGADSGDAARFRTRHAIDSETRILTLMPGSRRSEVTRLMPIYAAALKHLPNMLPVVPLAGPVADIVRDGTRQWPRQPLLVSETQDKYDAFAASSLALTKSGTSTLELAMAGVPMVMSYRLNPLTAVIARQLISVRYASIINLLAGREVIPELIQADCTPRRLAAEVNALLNDASMADAQRDGCHTALASLRPANGLPSEAAAAAVLNVLSSAASR